MPCGQTDFGRLTLCMLCLHQHRIDCAGILKLRNSDIELRKGETDIGRKNTRVRMVFRVHINQPTGRTVSLQASSNPIECCEYIFSYLFFLENMKCELLSPLITLKWIISRLIDCQQGGQDPPKGSEDVLQGLFKANNLWLEGKKNHTLVKLLITQRRDNHCNQSAPQMWGFDAFLSSFVIVN